MSFADRLNHAEQRRMSGSDDRCHFDRVFTVAFGGLIAIGIYKSM